MLSKNYSRDVIETEGMFAYELLDYDTVEHNWTGINSTRMRLPERYDISKYYKRNKRNPERGQWVKKGYTSLPDISDDFDWQITYSFPSAIHNNVSPLGKVYGGNSVTYRRLYLILCERLNGGEYFIDTYFDKVYPYTVKETIDVELNNIKGELLLYVEDIVLDGAVVTKSGKLDARYKANRGMKSRIRDYQKFASEWEGKKGADLADIIKEDIIRCLENGQIPLNHTANQPETVRKRLEAGYSPDQIFFALGDLINHIQLFVKIGGNKKWRTRQGLLV